MLYKLKLAVLLITSIFFTTNIISQKVFHVNLKLPIELNTDKVKIFYNNGKEWKRPKSQFINNEIVISDSFYSKFATIACGYYFNGKYSSYSNSFFVWDIPATIFFSHNTDSLTSPFLNNNLVNAYEIGKTEEAKQMNSFHADESKDYKEFSKKCTESNFENDSLCRLEKEKYKNLVYKQIEFIKQNGNLYYSLWIFKNELIVNDFPTPDSLLKIFDSSFTKNLKSTFEGKEVETILKGKISINENYYGATFKSIDIENKIVDFNNLKGKYILLHFWASWCVPCIAELPTIKKLNTEFANKNLVVISVSIDRDKQAFNKAVKKHKMNWINIFHDLNIENVFLKEGGIPQVYLIDPIGMLIYSQADEKDYDLKILSNIIKSNCK